MTESTVSAAEAALAKAANIPLDKYDPEADDDRPKGLRSPALRNAEVRPLRDYVVVEPDRMPDMIGLIVVPQTVKLGGCGTVLRAGSKVEHAKVGKRVHLSTYGTHWAGTEIRENGKLLVLIRERDINGIIEKIIE